MTNLSSRRNVLQPKTKVCHHKLRKFRGVSHTYVIKQLLKVILTLSLTRDTDSTLITTPGGAGAVRRYQERYEEKNQAVRQHQ